MLGFRYPYKASTVLEWHFSQSLPLTSLLLCLVFFLMSHWLMERLVVSCECCSFLVYFVTGKGLNHSLPSKDFSSNRKALFCLFKVTLKQNKHLYSVWPLHHYSGPAIFGYASAALHHISLSSGSSVKVRVTSAGIPSSSVKCKVSSSFSL